MATVKYRWPTDPAGTRPSHTISWEQHAAGANRQVSNLGRGNLLLGINPAGPIGNFPGSDVPRGDKTVNSFGQMITFAIEDGGDQRFSGSTTVISSKGNDTVRKICKNRGHPEAEGRVLALNNIKNANSHLKLGRRVRVPDRLRESQRFHVLAGDQAPRITDGYSKIRVVDRTERAGLSVFEGYNPLVMDVPVRFEAEDRSGSWAGADGTPIERDIELLEQMAGRGIIAGAAIGAPPILRVMTRNNQGDFVGLIPKAFQWTRGNTNNKLWWISGIDWDSDAQRNRHGERIRQLATITLTEYVSPDVLAPSKAERAKASRPKKKTKKRGK